MHLVSSFCGCKWLEQEGEMKSFTLQIILNTAANIFQRHESDHLVSQTKNWNIFFYHAV